MYFENVFFNFYILDILFAINNPYAFSFSRGRKHYYAGKCVSEFDYHVKSKTLKKNNVDFLSTEHRKKQMPA